MMKKITHVVVDDDDGNQGRYLFSFCWHEKLLRTEVKLSLALSAFLAV
jgi:hypothetical protein